MAGRNAQPNFATPNQIRPNLVQQNPANQNRLNQTSFFAFPATDEERLCARAIEHCNRVQTCLDSDMTAYHTLSYDDLMTMLRRYEYFHLKMTEAPLDRLTPAIHVRIDQVKTRISVFINSLAYLARNSANSPAAIARIGSNLSDHPQRDELGRLDQLSLVSPVRGDQRDDPFTPQRNSTHVDHFRPGRQTALNSTPPAANHRSAQPTAPSQSAFDGFKQSELFQKLDTLVFSGKNRDWPSFLDAFEERLKSGGPLSQQAKFHRLKSCLKQRQKDEIKCFARDPEAYQMALSCLEDFYGNREEARREIINDFKRSSEMQHVRDYDNLCILFIELRVARSELAQMGAPESRIEGELSPIIINKLPYELFGNAACDNWNLDACATLMRQTMQRLRVLQGSKHLPNRNRSSNATVKGESQEVVMASHQRSFNEFCLFCKDTHRSENCTKLKTFDKRAAHVKETASCYKCLRTGHYSKDCSNKNVTCRYCKRGHHSALCKKQLNKRILAVGLAEETVCSEFDNDQQTYGDLFDSDTASVNSHDDHDSTEALSGHTADIGDSVSAERQVNSHIRSYGITIPAPRVQAASTHGQRPTVTSTAEDRRLTTSFVIQSADPNLDQNSRLSAIALSAPTGVDRHSVYLKTLRVSLSNPQNVRVFIDEGGETSLVTTTVVRELNLPSRTIAPLDLTGIHGSSKSISCAVTLTMHSLVNNNTFSVDCLVVDHIPSPRLPLPSATVRKYAEDNDITLTDTEPADPTVHILIAADAAYGILQQTFVNITPWLAAVPTHLGWCLAGIDPISQTNSFSRNCCAALIDHNQELLEKCNRLYELEASEYAELISDPSQEFEPYMYYESDRLFTSLPWAADPSNLDNCFTLAYSRLKSVMKKWSAAGRLQDYETALLEYVKLGFAEPLKFPDKSGYFLPHSGVVKETSTTTKLRIVFDGSAKSAGSPSLNALLLKGPDKNPKVWQQLIRWRMSPIAAIADIQKAFLQIFIDPADRKYLQFLWERDGQVTAYRMTVLPFGLISSPSILGTGIHMHLRKYGRKAQLLADRFYVDDLILSASTTDELLEQKSFITNCMNEIGMTHCKWRCSQPTIDCTFTDDATADTSVLGVTWKVKDDLICITLPHYEVPSSVTRADTLSYVNGIFDPLSISSPLLLPLKSFNQQLARLNIGWYDPLSPELRGQFVNRVESLVAGTVLSIPRHPFTSANLYLAAFCDGSVDGYAACVYLVQPGHSSSLLCAKSRVAPITELSIPKMELVAARLAAVLIEQIRLDFPLIPVKCYSDANCNVQRLSTTPSKMDVFERNRIRDILKRTCISDWEHVKGTDNPADLPTRECSLANFSDAKQKLWFTGPEWLISKPAPPFNKPILPPIWTEPPIIRRKLVCSAKANSNCEVKDWRSVITFSQAVAAFSKRRTVKQHWMTYELRFLQSLMFSDLDTLIKNPTTRPNVQMRRWILFKDINGILRVQTRLQTGVEELDTPVVLDLTAPIALVWLRYWHSVLHHPSYNYMRNWLSNNFRAVGAKTAIRRVNRSCITCRTLYQPTEQPPPGSIPSFRTQQGRPFLNTGLDYFGPIYYSLDKSTRLEETDLPEETPVKKKRGRPRLNKRPSENVKRAKLYVLLFTCATTRAVHLEPVHRLDATCFELAFRNFLNRRGIPTTMYSDNGATFRRCQKNIDFIQQVLRCLNKDHVFRRIAWHFTTPLSPWQSGFIERLVGTIKRTLEKITFKTLPDYDHLVTYLIEAECLVNSRPVLQGSSEFSTVTPAHFLIGESLTNFPSLPKEEQRKLPADLSHYNAFQKIVDGFWQRWIKEYFSCLRNTLQLLPKKCNLKVGQLVLIEEPNIKRLNWPLAVIEKVHPGTDGIVRNVTIRRNGRTYSRPVQRIVPLEEATHLEPSSFTQ